MTEGKDMGLWLRLAAISGLISVAAGAFGAHGAASEQAKELFRTGATYQAIHSLAVFAAASLGASAWPRARIAAILFLAGAILFSGSLYLLALGAPRIVGAITPFGGVAFMAGWAALAWSVGARR